MRQVRLRLPAIVLPTIAGLVGVLAACAQTEQEDQIDSQPTDQTNHDTSQIVIFPVSSVDKWQLVDAAQDPFPEHRPSANPCTTNDLKIEGYVLELDTNTCNYAVIAQPIAQAIAQGSQLAFSFWWETLWSAEPASAHLAIVVAGELIWEEIIQIPGPADLRSVSWQAERDYLADETIVVHLHNHGINHWKLGQLTVESHR